MTEFNYFEKEDVMKYDRFDLEQSFLSCWNVVEDIKMLVEEKADASTFVSLAEFYDYKFSRVMKIMEEMIHNGDM